jgi:hypothetical protein
MLERREVKQACAQLATQQWCAAIPKAPTIADVGVVVESNVCSICTPTIKPMPLASNHVSHSLL